MLGEIRKGATSFFVKFLLLILVLSFVLWGVGDIFRGRNTDVVAKIGGEHVVRIDEYERALKTEINRIKQSYPNVPAEEISPENLGPIVLNNLINVKLLDIVSKEIGLDISDAQVMKTIGKNPRFLNEDKQFDKAIFLNLLRENNVSESTYIGLVKKDLLNQIIFAALLSNKIMPDILVDKVHNFAMQKRTANLFILPSNQDIKLPVPTQDDLKTYYEQAKASFVDPEFRTISYVKVSEADLLKNLKVTDDEVKQHYNDNVKKYSQAEKRDMYNLLFNDEETAKLALTQLKSGKDVTQVAKEFSLDTKSIFEKNISEGDFPKDIEAQVFALKENEVSDVITSKMGYHIFKVAAVTASKPIAFAEVSSKIREELTKEKGNEAFYKLSKDVDADVTSGMNLSEIAEKNNLNIEKIESINSSGANHSGQSKIADITAPKEFLEAAFTIDESSESEPIFDNKSNQFYVIRVDKVIPSYQKTMDEVRPEILTAWNKEAKTRELQNIANQFVNKVKAGEKPEDVAKSLNVKLAGVKTLERKPQADGVIPDQLIDQLFLLKQGEITPAVQNKSADFVMAVLTDIILPAKDDSAKLSVKNAIANIYDNSTIEQLVIYVRNKHPVKINEDLIQRLGKNEG